MFDNSETTIEVDGKVEHLSLWDTAGQEEYDHIRPLSYPDSDIFLICFSVDATNSFTNIEQKWLPELRKHESKTPFIVVGTKADLRDDDGIVAEKLSLGKPMKTKEEIQEIVKAWPNCVGMFKKKKKVQLILLFRLYGMLSFHKSGVGGTL